MKNFRKLTAALAALTILFSLTACNAETMFATTPAPALVSNDSGDSDSTIDILSDTTEIKLKKASLSVGDSWRVSTSKGGVATIKGQPIYLIGDTYSLFTPSGNLVASEGEAYRLVNRNAAFYDYNNELTGSISQEILSLLYKFTIYDAEDNVVGTAHQNFAIGLSGEIRNTAGEVVWKFDRAIFSWGADLTLTRVGDSDITAIDAIWVSVIMNEIYEADEAKSTHEDDGPRNNSRNNNW